MAYPNLTITVQGRIIDHLGIQMYQSPTAAIAELIANAWDADAENVIVKIPESIAPEESIEIIDDGIGMTAEECQSRFLSVGACRRADGKDHSEIKKRPVLGKKGIGKFSGFGIASEIVIDTTSIQTGERTKFILNLEELRNEAMDNKPVTVLEYEPPSPDRISRHGTFLTLRKLNLPRYIQLDRFRISMSRKFSLQSRSSDFQIYINDKTLTDGFDTASAEFDFPTSYEEDERPTKMTMDNGWGIETLPNGKVVRWRFLFMASPVDDEELRGIAVFCRGKIAQRPFIFNLTGGLGGQHGLEYLTGRVEADYIDELSVDLIAPERQRIDWENAETHPLEIWGQERTKSLIRLWKERRAEKRTQEIELRISAYSRRLDKFPAHEQKIVHTALKKIAEIDTLEDDRLESLCDSILTAWEGGRLKDLISSISNVAEPTAESVLSLLSEAEVLTALNTAEVIKTKLEAIMVLEKAIEKRTLENRLRDHVAAHPYLLDPKWETYRVEKSLGHILEEAEKAAKRDNNERIEGQRIDLLFRGGSSFLVVEFMRPGLKTDRDHLERLELYIDYIREIVRTRTELGFHEVIGLFVGDRSEGDPMIAKKIEHLNNQGITAMTWADLLGKSKQTWREFLDIVKMRAPDDERIAAL